MPIARINDHDMYYEVLGQGDPVLCMGGWGTFCHENHAPPGARPDRPLPGRSLFDYRGIRESGDDLAVPSTMELHANDAIGLLDHLGLTNVHLMGLVGMGACVCQEIAIRRPDLARSMLNMGAWCEVDDFLRDQLEMFRWIHRDLGFLPFQKAVTLLSFDAEYYNANKDRLLGPTGGWKELNGRYTAHSRLIDACVGFESKSRLAADPLPVADHPRRQGRRDGAAHHAADRARHSRRARRALGRRRPRGRRQGAEDPLREHAVRLARRPTERPAVRHASPLRHWIVPGARSPPASRSAPGSTTSGGRPRPRAWPAASSRSARSGSTPAHDRRPAGVRDARSRPWRACPTPWRPAGSPRAPSAGSRSCCCSRACWPCC